MRFSGPGRRSPKCRRDCLGGFPCPEIPLGDPLLPAGAPTRMPVQRRKPARLMRALPGGAPWSPIRRGKDRPQVEVGTKTGRTVAFSLDVVFELAQWWPQRRARVFV